MARPKSGQKSGMSCSARRGARRGATAGELWSAGPDPRPSLAQALGGFKQRILGLVCAEKLTLAPEGSVGFEEPKGDTQGSSETRSPAGCGCGRGWEVRFWVQL